MQNTAQTELKATDIGLQSRCRKGNVEKRFVLFDICVSLIFFQTKEETKNVGKEETEVTRGRKR